MRLNKDLLCQQEVHRSIHHLNNHQKRHTANHENPGPPRHRLIHSNAHQNKGPQDPHHSPQPHKPSQIDQLRLLIEVTQSLELPSPEGLPALDLEADAKANNHCQHEGADWGPADGEDVDCQEGVDRDEVHVGHADDYRVEEGEGIGQGVAEEA